MQALHLDYQQSFRPFPILGAILLVCALAVIAQLGRQYLYFGQVLAGWEAREDQVARVTQRHDGRGPTSHQDQEQLSREVTKANEVLRRVALPWGALFQAVETAAPTDVALLAMEPDADKQVLKIVGEAKDVAAMLDYLKTLEGATLFRTVTLQSHQIQQQDPQRPIRFTLLAAWTERP
jgi:hypothetical protein